MLYIGSNDYSSPLSKEEMRRTKYYIIVVICALFFVKGAYTIFASAAESESISGRLEGGYRILAAPPESSELQFTVYRGDYIKFDHGEMGGEVLLEIPALGIKESVKADYLTAPYFKMKKVGSYPFTLGESKGEIDVVEFDRPQYAVLTADEAASLIANISPVILDVRTPQEYSSGHMENSILIPVQELQQRWQELAKYKDEDVFIYCATGNRSTVAAKILIDNGFNRIHNLRYGVFDWARKGYPVTR